jgi:hypothetical protein
MIRLRRVFQLVVSVAQRGGESILGNKPWRRAPSSTLEGCGSVVKVW